MKSYLFTFNADEVSEKEEGDEEIKEKELDKLLAAESDESLAALLAAELHETKKISLETLIYLQNKDEKIREVRELLMLNEKGFKNFVVKSGLVCRIHGRMVSR